MIPVIPKIMLVLAVSEYAIMYFLSQWAQWMYLWLSILLDASMLTLVSTSILYFWLIKPVVKELYAESGELKTPRRGEFLQFSTLLLKSGIIIFVVEVVVMLLIMTTVDDGSKIRSLLDALSVSIISAPLIFLWVVKPLYTKTGGFLEHNTKTKLQQIVKRFMLFFLPSSVIFILAVLATQQISMNAEIERVRDDEEYYIRKQKDHIFSNLANVFSDLTFLANQQDLTRIQDSISITGRNFLGIDFKVFMESKLIYDQIRFINPEGMEVVRANFVDGQAVIVPTNQLQSKKDRYYYQQTVGWQKDELFISHFDLNIENGEIEYPRKPVIRFALPVINNDGQNRGIVILNYLGNKMLDQLRATAAKRTDEFMVLNAKGYWLLGPNPEDEWAFMYKQKLDRSFGNDHPQAWEKISTSHTGQFILNGAMYTFDTIHPKDLLLNSNIWTESSTERFMTLINSESLAWKIVSVMPPDILNEHLHQSLKQLQLFYILIFLFLVSGSGTLAFVLTTRKMSQDALAASEISYRKIIDESISTIFTTNVNGELTYVNPSAEGLTGYSSTELFDKSFTEIIREDWQERVRIFYYQQFKNRQPETILEFPIITKSGQERWVEQLSSLLFDDDQRILGFQSIVHDISERKKVEKELFIAKQLAEEASQLKSEFLANMSHELRTPLNSVIGFSKVLMEKNKTTLDEKDQNYLQRILANGTHLLELINDVLDLSKIEAGRTELEIVNISLSQLIHDIIGQLEGQVQGKNFELVTEIPENIAPIQTDPGKLKQIILNLLSNAIKFTNEGVVEVRVETNATTNQATLIRVRDTGIGIPEDRLESVFDEFEQVDSSTTRKYGGTGLGLAISKSLCELMGYKLKVVSQLGQGSVFSILLSEPESTASSSYQGTEKRKTNRSQQDSDAFPSIRDKRILIVDDNHDSRFLIEQTLAEQGCRTLHAEDGFKGFDLALKEQPDLIILDLKMKKMSGEEVLARLKANDTTKNIPVVIVSIVALENKARLADAVEFVQKPIHREALIWAITRHIGAKP